MSPTQRDRWTVVLTVVGLALLFVGVTRLVSAWITGGAAIADPEASTLGTILAAASAGVATIVAMSRRRRAASLPATADQVDQAAANLAAAVREQWSAEARSRALGDKVPMPVRWRLSRTTPMDFATMISSQQSLTFSGS